MFNFFSCYPLSRTSGKPRVKLWAEPMVLFTKNQIKFARFSIIPPLPRYSPISVTFRIARNPTAVT